MWILDWLPDFIFHLIFVIGVLAIVAGYFLDSIPFVSKNAKVIQVAGIIVTVIGVWFEGGIANEAHWQARVKELEAKIARAEAASAEANAALVQALANNSILIKENTAAQKQRLKDQADLLNKECRINQGVLNILNDAAKNRTGGTK